MRVSDHQQSKRLIPIARSGLLSGFHGWRGSRDGARFITVVFFGDLLFYQSACAICSLSRLSGSAYPAFGIAGN